MRLFLNRFHEFDKAMKATDQKPTWLKSYNFLCLLNLPDTIQEFGPCRRWFEGKWLGERYVSTVKQERGRCPPKNVASILMRNLHRNKAADCLVPSIRKQSSAEILGLNTRIYGSIPEMDEQYQTRLPLPIVILGDGGMGCLYYEIGRNTGDNISFCRIEKIEMENSKTMHHGLKYWKYTFVEGKQGLEEIMVEDYGVLLPRLGSDELGVYTIVTKKWSTEMFAEYDFALESQNYIRSDVNAPDAAWIKHVFEEEEWI